MKYQSLYLTTFGLLLACSGPDTASTNNSTAGATGFAGGGTGGMAGSATGQSGAGGTATAGGGAGGTAGAAAGAAGTSLGGGGAGTGGIGGTGGVAAGGAAGMAGGGAGGTTAATGADLYLTHCSACHGPEGAGTAVDANQIPLGPEIKHPVPDFTLWMVRNGTAGRTGGMNPYDAPMVPLPEAIVSDAQLDLIIEYLDSFPQPTTGEGLFLDYCANCHGADGMGAGTTRDLTGIADLAAEVPTRVRDGAHAGEFNLRIEYMPAQNATELSDAELTLIAQHIETL